MLFGFFHPSLVHIFTKIYPLLNEREFIIKPKQDVAFLPKVATLMATAGNTDTSVKKAKNKDTRSKTGFQEPQKYDLIKRMTLLLSYWLINVELGSLVSQKDITAMMTVDLICMGMAFRVIVAENSVCTINDAVNVKAVRAHQRKG